LKGLRARITCRDAAARGSVHRHQMLARSRLPAALPLRRLLSTKAIPPPKLFDYATVTSHIHVSDAISAVEAAFGALARGKVDVPFPMHIGIDETASAGPGDCHIKGGYVSGESTWTVKLACVSFYKNVADGLPPGGGIFVVMNAKNGAPLAVIQENRFLTDVRTGAAGGISVKYLTKPTDKTVGFIGTGAIAKSMARATAAVRPGFTGFAYGADAEMAQSFCDEMRAELGCEFTAVGSAEELCASAKVVFTQTPGSATVLERSMLQPGSTVIASGSDQPTKQELPVDLLANCKYVCDLVGQVSKVGELRSALAAGAMTEADVYAELGQVVNGDKPGREGDEIIVCDLTGTGAQDAAIGQVAWEKLSKL